MRWNLLDTRAGYWSWALFLTGSQLQPAVAADAPSYQIERCCSVCPQMMQDSAYSGGMSEFTKLVPGQDDWLFRTKTDLMTQMGTTEEGYNHLQQLRDALKRKGVELMVVYIPTRGMANQGMLNPQVRQDYDFDLAKNNYHTVVERMRGLGILVPDLTPLLEQHGDASKPYFFKRDHHWTPYGAQFTAGLVAEELRKSDAFKSVPHKEFVTTTDGQMNKIGSLNQALGKLCGYSYSHQYVSRFVTEPKDESGDLFGNADAAQVVLAGTSFSSPQYNFGGFLKQQANVDIDNRSVSGGGFHSAMLQYLGSEEFQQHPPKVLIWEITSYYDISMPLFYRQIMPMLDDGCRATAISMSQKIKLHPGANELLVNADVKSIHSEDYVADVQFSQPQVKTLQTSLLYMSGTRENLKIERSREVEPDGRFVFRLREGPDWNGQTLLAMQIDMPPNMPAGLEVEASLCARSPANKAQLQVRRE